MHPRPLALVRLRRTLTVLVLFAFIIINLAFATAHMERAKSSPAAPLTGFVVNSTDDGADVSQGNGVCETATGNGVCTLRAAIQEANAFAGNDIITFNIPNTDPGCTGGV
ncbi:MAG: CSLREA domain-containing protein, partial [Acidobacteria bacterium]|nr:CSLREA domain-containing protein [Acidobacteriota bacterium]